MTLINKALCSLVAVKDGVLPLEVCQGLIDKFNDETAVKRVAAPEYQFDVLNCNETPGWRAAAQYVAELASQAAHKHFEDLGVRRFVPSVENFEHVRMKRYRPGDEFTDHVDVGDAATAGRMLVCLFYLNDCRGGETDFGDRFNVQPKAGRLVMFPPMWMFPHAGRGLVVGDCAKYTIATFLRYPDVCPSRLSSIAGAAAPIRQEA